MDDLTLGDIRPVLELVIQLADQLQVNNFPELFDKLEEMIKQAGYWNEEVAAGFAEAEAQLAAHPELFGAGIQEFKAAVVDILASYPDSTPITQIPELGGIGGNPDLPPIDLGPGGIQIADLAATFAEVTVDFDPSTGVVTVNGGGYSFSLPDIARIAFEDGTLAFDFSGIAGQAFRIYQAAFDRTPDQGGLSYWIHEMDAGKTLYETAAGFVASAEFKAVYGEDPTALELITKLYQNVLGRDGEQAGIDYWVGEVESGKTTVDTLMAFSESPENVQGVAPAISDGIFYV